MIIASEIKQKLPQESSRLERLARQFYDFHDSEVYVAQAEYQALMDAANAEDGKPLDNERARVFSCEFYWPPSRIEINRNVWVFADEGPGREAYDAIVEETKLLLYFREDIHRTHIALRQSIKKAADDLVGKMLKTFYGDNYRGIYLFASMFSEREPHYVPTFALGRKSGHWDYAADFFEERDKDVLPAAQIIDNPWAFDRELSEKILTELYKSHKSARFVNWIIGKQPPPEVIRFGGYDIVYVGNDLDIAEDVIPIVPSLAKVGGLLVADIGWLSDELLHGHRNLRPFFTAEHYISLPQFLIKTK